MGSWLGFSEEEEEEGERPLPFRGCSSERSGAVRETSPGLFVGRLRGCSPNGSRAVRLTDFAVRRSVRGTDPGCSPNGARCSVDGPHPQGFPLGSVAVVGAAVVISVAVVRPHPSSVVIVAAAAVVIIRRRPPSSSVVVLVPKKAFLEGPGPF